MKDIKDKGFTLIELISVLVILAIIAIIVTPLVLNIVRKAKDAAGRLICCGMAALIGFQSIVNICVATGLLPNTGVTLPFVSYGGTSLILLMAEIGLALSVSRQIRLEDPT